MFHLLNESSPRFRKDKIDLINLSLTLSNTEHMCFIFRYRIAGRPGMEEVVVDGVFFDSIRRSNDIIIIDELGIPTFVVPDSLSKRYIDPEFLREVKNNQYRLVGHYGSGGLENIHKFITSENSWTEDQFENFLTDWCNYVLRIMGKKSDPEVQKIINSLIERESAYPDFILPSMTSDKLSRTEIIQGLIDTNKYKRYLEIGYGDGKNFHQINCNTKEVIDPRPISEIRDIYKIINDPFKDNEKFIEDYSDSFFNNYNKKHDIIFIDGFHEYRQVERDIENSLCALSEGGTIVMHDLNPSNYFSQSSPPASNGDTWKAFASLREKRDDLEMTTVCTDQGVGIVRKGRQEKYIDPGFSLSYEYFSENRKDILNMISIEEYKKGVENTSVDNK